MTPSKFSLPHSSFESMRKQAKKLARQVAAGDPDALARVHAQLPAPGARATHATDAPSTSVSSTILRFSAMLRRCRLSATDNSLSLGITAVCWEVSISAPSGIARPDTA